MFGYGYRENSKISDFVWERSQRTYILDVRPHNGVPMVEFEGGTERFGVHEETGGIAERRFATYAGQFIHIYIYPVKSLFASLLSPVIDFTKRVKSLKIVLSRMIPELPGE